MRECIAAVCNYRGVCVEDLDGPGFSCVCEPDVVGKVCQTGKTCELGKLSDILKRKKSNMCRFSASCKIIQIFKHCDMNDDVCC